MKPNNTRLKVLLIILGVIVIIFAIVFYKYGPYSEAAKGGVKGKPTPTASATVGASPSPSSRVSPSPSSAVSPSPSPTATLATLFSDDFSTTLSKWQVVYQTASIQSGQLDLIPLYQTYNSPSDTHAPLIVAGDTAWKDYVFNVTMKTTRHLRPSNPNPWEVGWLIFRYVDSKNFYYFIHKTNGIELGKLVNGSQQFIYTAGTPQLAIGSSHTYKVVLKGSNIKIYIDGAQVVNVNDSSFSAGEIGLYNEDSETLSDNVLVTSN